MIIIVHTEVDLWNTWSKLWSVHRKDLATDKDESHPMLMVDAKLHAFYLRNMEAFKNVEVQLSTDEMLKFKMIKNLPLEIKDPPLNHKECLNESEMILSLLMQK